MMHQVPHAKVVDREAFIVERCNGKRVLNLGCASGTLHGKIKAVANRIIGVDKVATGEPNQLVMDLDRIECIDPWWEIEGKPDHMERAEFDVIVAGEIVEHLGNPGNLLEHLRDFKCPVLITVPNAFHVAGLRWMKEGYEQVNPDHVAWYSYKTMKTLIERYSFTIQEFYWYNGQPLTAEGMIFVVN